MASGARVKSAFTVIMVFLTIPSDLKPNPNAALCEEIETNAVDVLRTIDERKDEGSDYSVQELIYWDYAKK